MDWDGVPAVKLEIVSGVLPPPFEEALDTPEHPLARMTNASARHKKPYLRFVKVPVVEDKPISFMTRPLLPKTNLRYPCQAAKMKAQTFPQLKRLATANGAGYCPRGQNRARGIVCPVAYHATSEHRSQSRFRPGKVRGRFVSGRRHYISPRMANEELRRNVRHASVKRYHNRRRAITVRRRPERGPCLR